MTARNMGIEDAAFWAQRERELNGTAARERKLADDALTARVHAAFDAEWTRETTIARRAAWNALVTSGGLTARDGKLDMHKLNAQTAAQGWTQHDLKRAVTAHDL